jgi:hypothetical protein
MLNSLITTLGNLHDKTVGDSCSAAQQTGIADSA